MTSWHHDLVNNLTILSQVQWPEMHGKHIAWWSAAVWRALSRRMRIIGAWHQTWPHHTKNHRSHEIHWLLKLLIIWSLQVNHPQKRGHTGVTGHENCCRQCPPGIPIKGVMTDAMFTLIGWGILWPLDFLVKKTAWVWTITEELHEFRTYDSYDSYWFHRFF